MPPLYYSFSIRLSVSRVTVPPSVWLNISEWHTRKAQRRGSTHWCPRADTNSQATHICLSLSVCFFLWTVYCWSSTQKAGWQTQAVPTADRQKTLLNSAAAMPLQSHACAVWKKSQYEESQKCRGPSSCRCRNTPTPLLTGWWKTIKYLIKLLHSCLIPYNDRPLSCTITLAHKDQEITTITFKGVVGRSSC